MTIHRDFIEQNFNEWVHIRRHLHAHPELSHQEKNTATFISEKLKSWGVSHQTNIAGHGISGIIQPEETDITSTIVLRADMDGLPIQEMHDVEYASKISGVMHACGHDVHMTILLATIQYLHIHRNKLTQPVRFLFQPAEEKAPSGAKAVMQTGILHGVTAIYGLHVSPELPTGTLGFCQGPFMASSNELHLCFYGMGGHAAQVNIKQNSLFAASEWLSFAETLNSKENQLRINFGKIAGCGATNVVPEKVEISGTLRSFNEKQRLECIQMLQHKAEEISGRRNIRIDFMLPEGYPVLVNHPELCEELQKTISERAGHIHCISIPQRYGSEDFAWYTQEIPGCFIRLGTGNADGSQTTSLHKPDFDVDENSIKAGVETFILACNLHS